MKPQTLKIHFAPGHHVFETESEGWLLYEPSGAFVRLRAPDESLRRLVTHIDGDAAADEPGDAIVDLLNRFESRGVVERVSSEQGEANEPNSKRRFSRRVQILGAGPIADALGRILENEDDLAIATNETEPHRALIDDLDLVIDCAGWLPDARWQARDEACRERSVAWHGCYAEGDRFYLGPFFLPDDPMTVSYRDVRARRLAAAPYPEGLEGYWRHLDAGIAVTEVTWPHAGGAAQIAGTLAADVSAWARGETPPSHGHQLAFAPATGRWTWHPVLPVPRGLMTECTDLEPLAFEAAG